MNNKIDLKQLRVFIDPWVDSAPFFEKIGLVWEYRVKKVNEWLVLYVDWHVDHQSTEFDSSMLKYAEQNTICYERSAIVLTFQFPQAPLLTSMGLSCQPCVDIGLCHGDGSQLKGISFHSLDICKWGIVLYFCPSAFFSGGEVIQVEKD